MNKVEEIIMYIVLIPTLTIIAIIMYGMEKFGAGLILGLALVLLLFALPIHEKITSQIARHVKGSIALKLKNLPLLVFILALILFVYSYYTKSFLFSFISVICIFTILYISMILSKAKEN